MSDEGVAFVRLGELGGEIAAGAILKLKFDNFWVVELRARSVDGLGGL
jgi:hypothetical protein